MRTFGYTEETARKRAKKQSLFWLPILITLFFALAFLFNYLTDNLLLDHSLYFVVLLIVGTAAVVVGWRKGLQQSVKLLMQEKYVLTDFALEKWEASGKVHKLPWPELQDVKPEDHSQLVVGKHRKISVPNDLPEAAKILYVANAKMLENQENSSAEDQSPHEDKP